MPPIPAFERTSRSARPFVAGTAGGGPLNSDVRPQGDSACPTFRRNFATYLNSLVPSTHSNLNAKDCDVLFASYPAGTAIEPHHHETENVGVITEGELILVLDGKESRYGPGQWYHVPARAVHAARFEKPTSEIEFWFYQAPGNVA